MRVVIADGEGGPEVLRVVDRPVPTVAADELLVRVRSTSVNRADVLQRQGHYPPPRGAGDVLGLELAGTVAEVGREVRGWHAGDRVCAVVAAGGYAEYATVPAATALRLPDAVDWDQAGGLAEVFATAHDNLVVRGRLAPGETVLLHGIGSGVGTAATQLAVRAGATVHGTSSRASTLAAVRALGASDGIDYREEDFVARVSQLTAGRGVDVVLDMIGGAYLDRNLRTLAADGRLVVIGLQQGASAELDLARMLQRRLTVTASTLRARSVDQKAAVAHALRRDVMPGFADGSLRVVVHAVHELDDVAAAHAELERGGHVGKIILRVA